MARERSSSTSSLWATLPIEIWTLIFQKLVLEDFIQCKAVCSWWLSMLRDLSSCGALPRVPWIAIPSCSGHWDFLDIATNKTCRIHLPQLRATTILGCFDGWIIPTDRRTTNIQLFNPFTRAQIPLPPTTTFPGVVSADRTSQGNVTVYHVQLGPMKPWQVVDHYFGDAFLSFSRDGYTVVVKRRGLGFAFVKAGDAAWVRICCIAQSSRVCSDGRVFSVDRNNINDLPLTFIEVYGPNRPCNSDSVIVGSRIHFPHQPPPPPPRPISFSLSLSRRRPHYGRSNKLALQRSIDVEGH